MPALDEKEVEQLRSLTPGCRDGRIHFNHAGASLPSDQTLDTIIGHLRREAEMGPHEAALSVQDQRDQARRDAAALLNAQPADVAFTSSGSAGWGLAFAAMPPLRAGDRVLVGRHEWGGNLATLHAAAARADARIEVVPCQPDGAIDVAALAAMIDDRVRLIALTWLPANGGLINDAAAVGAVARATGIPYFIDAGQALGQIEVDVRALGCDVLKGAGRKHLRGPRGTALLYVGESFRARLRPAFLDVNSAPWGDDGPRIRSDARMFETSEVPVSLILGLGAALSQTLEIGVGRIRQRIDGLASRLRRDLAASPGVTVHDLGTQRSGLVSFTVAGRDATDVGNRLAAHGIAVGVNGQPYTPLDMAERGLQHIVRASVSYLNTEAEIDRLTAEVAALSR